MATHPRQDAVQLFGGVAEKLVSRELSVLGWTAADHFIRGLIPFLGRP